MKDSPYQEKLAEISSLPGTLRPVVLAALLTSLFKEEGVDLTIVGGAAVQFYTQSKYVTKDLDTILHGDTKEIIEKIMRGLGFKRTTTYRHFEHPFFDFMIEFPPSPIQVASRTINDVNIVTTPEGPVRIIKIEDIIMDRITASIEWKDRASLQQAKLMWRKHKNRIDQDYLTTFAKKEGYLKTLREVMKS